MTFALAIFTSPWDSSYIVPVAGCFMIARHRRRQHCWPAVRKREIESQERLAAIAKGLVPCRPPTQEELELTRVRPASSGVRRFNNIRLAGIILVSGAIGVMLFFFALTIILRQREILSGVACGLVPLGIGIAFLIDAKLQKRDQEAVTAPPTT
jgi:hypothetical protein